MNITSIVAYCCCIRLFLSVIKVLLLYNPNYSKLSLLADTGKIWCLV